MKTEELWADFCRKKNIDINTPYEAWAFCGGGPAADELAELVLKRRKFGTASAYDDYVFENAIDEIPKQGDYSVILNNNNDAVCIIRDYDVYIRAFGDVSSFHAYSEGEGDRTLEYWKEVHTRVFGPNLEKEGMPLTDESLIVCEKFTVEYVSGEEQFEDDEFMFVEPTMAYAEEINSYRQEMLETGSSFDGCFSMERLADTKEFVDSCITWSNPRRSIDEHGVRGNVIMCIRKSDGRMVGCMQVHHILTERMKIYTGHVGYSVRPSERRKGYATRILAKAKDFLTSFGFDEIYVNCLPENVRSRKTILANGGEYIETVYWAEENVHLERYGIKL